MEILTNDWNSVGKKQETRGPGCTWKTLIIRYKFHQSNQGKQDTLYEKRHNINNNNSN